MFDHIQTSSKYFTVNLSNLSTGSYTSYPLAISSSTVTIQDQEQGTFRLASTTYSVTEGNSVTLTIERYSGSFGSVDVNLTSSNGTAAAGTDFTAVNTTVAFQDGDLTKTLAVATIENSTNVSPPPLTFTVGIKDVTTAKSGGALVGTPSYTTISITDNETGSIKFSSSSYTGSIGNIITIPVQRYIATGAPDLSATASIGVSGGTAVSGVDYTNIFPYTVTWADQVSGSVNISLQTLSTNIWAGNKTLVLTASGLTNIGAGSIMTASILFDAGIIQQSVQPYPNISADFTINNFTNASSQYTRRVAQVPFRFGINGPATIRGSTYKTTKG